MIKLYTIPHSGTRWLMRVLDQFQIEYEHEHITECSYIDKESFIKAVITLRDPILCRIARINRSHNFLERVSHPVWLWRQVVRLEDNPYVHFFHIQDPRDNEVELLLDFCNIQSDSTEVDWTPYRASKDIHGLRKLYLQGTEPDILKPDILTCKYAGLKHFFKRQGYDFPRMS